MERFVWKVSDNETGNKWTVYVIATLADGQQDLELLDTNMEDYFDEF